MAADMTMALCFVTVLVFTLFNTTHQAKRLLVTNSENLEQQLNELQLEIQNMKTKQETELRDLNAKLETQENTIQNQEKKIVSQETTINQLLSQVSKLKPDTGSTFTRWGKQTCPTNATLVYTGFTAGSAYTEHGSSGSSVCLPNDPIWSPKDPPHDSYRISHMYGSEYEFNIFSQNLVNNDMPCSVCMTSPGSEVLMIPGRNRCHAGWNEEYSGYLIGPDYHYASEDFLCLDNQPDTVSGGSSNLDGRLFYLVVTQCGSLTCPPYENNRVVTCVVCSK